MKKTVLFLAALCLVMLSCTKDKTDYEAEIETIVPEYLEFKEAAALQVDGYDISVEALNGTFYQGYNEIRFKVNRSGTKANATITAATFLPIRTAADQSSTSCPHQYQLTHNTDLPYLSGYVVFTQKSETDGNWDLYISFTAGNQTHSAKHRITVEEQTNKNLNMTTFTGKDGEQYTIALVSPQRPKVGENELKAGIYKFNKPTGSPSGPFPDPTQFSYTVANGYTLHLDPRMPEPSMGNHSSPNNLDLTQQDDGLYRGVVNYTMTGNWTLNFRLSNTQGQILRGTIVPEDFTPGVPGVKSELYIDTLF